MELATVHEDGVLVLRVSGRVGSPQAADFEEAVLAAIKEADRALLLDCSALIYISSAGLRCVGLASRAAAARGVGFGLCSLSRMVQEVFRISGFDQVVKIHPSLGDAVSSSAPHATGGFRARRDDRRRVARDQAIRE